MASQNEQAASRRADTVRALEEELVGYERSGKEDRAKQVRAELARFKKPEGRKAPESSDAADSKPAKKSARKG